MTTASSLPADLAGYVVEQDYSRYDAADQATWHFVLRHLRDHLQHVAHPSYLRGLERTGLSSGALPRIAEMDQRLAELGWGAVCVSGFLPPRVFQAFQGLSILPIAADIRTPQHLSYTPAPDIIHEAAGHAPILVEPTYASYLRAIGSISERAFSTPEDHAVYQAIAQLSVVKENPSATPEQIDAAERRLQRALSVQQHTSEATRMARLYWWTAEYGLIGTPRHPLLYGAGLLSSLGEARSCLEPQVQKRWLSIECLDCDYDITRPQPQLFVAKNFEQLHEVLQRADAKLASTRGGIDAVQAAQQSRLPAVLEWTNGCAVRGTVRAHQSDAHGIAAISLVGQATVSWPQQAYSVGSVTDPPRNWTIPLKLKPVQPLEPDAIRRAAASCTRLTLQSESCRVEGRVQGAVMVERPAHPSLLLALDLADVLLHFPDGTRERRERWLLPLFGTELTARPDDREVTKTFPSCRQAPPKRQLDERARRLRQLYEQARLLGNNVSGPRTRARLEVLYDALDRQYPDEWLLRWLLLERLTADGVHPPERIVEDLRRLERRFEFREPIATGLRSLGLGSPAWSADA